MRGSGAERAAGGRERPPVDKVAVGTVPLHRLFAFADRADAALMAVGTVAAVANGMARPLMTFILGDVIDAFGSTDSSSNVVHRVSKVILNFVYLAIGTGLASTLQVSCWTITGERQAARIRALYLKAILRQDITYFDMEMRTGQVTERMAGDTFLIQDAIGDKVGMSIQLLSTFFGGFIVAFIRGWLLALVMLSSIPPIALSFVIMSKLRIRLSAHMQAKYSDAGNVVEQTLGAIRTVVSFNGEKQAIKMYNKLIKKAYESAILEGVVNGLGLGSMELSLFCSYGLAVWYGSRLIVEHGYNGGLVISIIMAVTIGAMSLGLATPSMTAFAEGQAAAYRMFKTIERQPDIDIYDTTGIILEDIKGDVELKDVYFSYPTRSEHLVFDGFSLRVPSGTTMALVGESGCGKSTVISLVERFYDPQAGEVLIDGVNIRRMNLGWIRGKIGLGLDTMVGERGIQLSGGQKQRIAIARAIVKNPTILLLDEATSALDMESERSVQEALNRVMLERTTVIVAHRLSTVKNADVISVLQNGKMVEQGSHVELMRIPEGSYSKLIRLQDTRMGAESSRIDYDMMETKSFGSRSINTKLRSKSFSVRSLSKGSSSIGHSDRHSFSASPSLPDPSEFIPASNVQYTTDKVMPIGAKKVPIARLFYLNKPEALVLALGSITAAMHGLILPLFGTLISTAIKTFYEPSEKIPKDSRFWASMFVALAACSFALIPVEYFLFGLAGGKLVERIRSLMFQRVMSQDINWFDKPEHSSGLIGARLSTNAIIVKQLVGDNLAINVRTLSTIVSGLTIAMVANWKLALIITVVAPFFGLQAYAQMLFLNGLNKNAKVKYEEASQVATDAVGSIRTVASFCAEKNVMETYEKKCESPLRKGIREGVAGGLGFGFSFLVFYFAYALCFYVGAKFVLQGMATFPEVFKVFFVLVMGTTGISRSNAIGADSNRANDAAISILEILDFKSKIHYSNDEGVTIASPRGDIDLQNVCFTYPLRPTVQIFKDLSLSIPSGKTVALVGESGSGKSTVIALLERFYDPDSGKILFDNVDLQTLKVSWLRQQVGLVAQEPVLFNDTIQTNIAYGRQGEASEEEIVAAAEAANAHEFISALPDGYNTVVGERGIQLSGGQKQRVAIARAIIKNPKVLLLDEATSALDVESERVVQEALDNVVVGRTTVVVAHRLSTIRGADIIAVLKNGAVVEKGRHGELMRIKDGIYASLVELSCSSA
ncbi:unnamed protein product [Urochloa decumbens]|uniref:Uncharacterized protein n=1 Tax=Urochloa decumbens TaxID=240449 RepID=A0ABC8ZBF4_9POAL